MNRKIAAAVVGAAVAAGAAFAVAGDEGREHGREGHRAKMLERFDTNKDGQLDDQEREAAKAARKAEIPFIGVLCGGSSQRQLTDAGAIAVYKDPADLLIHYATSPICQSIGYAERP